MSNAGDSPLTIKREYKTFSFDNPHDDAIDISNIGPIEVLRALTDENDTSAPALGNLLGERSLGSKFLADARGLRRRSHEGYCRCRYFELAYKWDNIDQMVQVLGAIFKDGVFKPDRPPALLDCERVRLLVETINGDEATRREASWATLRRLWETSRLDFGDDRLTRDQRHERH